MNYRKIYCDSENCPVSGNCSRHIDNLEDVDFKRIIAEEFDLNDECTNYDPIKEDV
jgi:hypothetical protein